MVKKPSGKRFLSRIAIPAGLTRVPVRAKCNLHGFGGGGILVDLSHEGGEDYKV